MILSTSFTRTYFNTAATLAIAAVLGWSGAARAALDNSEAFCQDTLAIDPNIALANNVHFIPRSSDYDDARNQLKDSLLPIMPADHTTIWNLGSRILTQVPTDWDLSNTANQYFLIVRGKTVQTGTYRPALGQFIQTIGIARVEPSAQTPTVALKIIAAQQEVTANDQLISASCAPHAIATIDTTDLGVAIDPTTEIAPKVVAFLDENTVGARDSVVLVDKGLNDGVLVGQAWDLVDQLPNQPASAKSFGRAKVIQSFTDVSMLRIGNVSHEVRLQTLLRRIQP